MKILALNGSPRGAAGNTEQMVRSFLEGARAAGAEVETLYVKDLKVGFCTGCFVCWTASPGRCFQRDDMDMVLDKIKAADVLLWATPLYHFGMTAMLKALLERTLPLVDPRLVKRDDACEHDLRDGLEPPRSILFSNCGFPEMSHFDALKAHFEGACPGETLFVFRPGGEMLRAEEARPHLQWYFDALHAAGREYVEQGSVSEGTMDILKRDLMPPEMYIEMANKHWEEVQGEKKDAAK